MSDSGYVFSELWLVAVVLRGFAQSGLIGKCCVGCCLALLQVIQVLWATKNLPLEFSRSQLICRVDLGRFIENRTLNSSKHGFWWVGILPYLRYEDVRKCIAVREQMSTNSSGTCMWMSCICLLTGMGRSHPFLGWDLPVPQDVFRFRAVAFSMYQNNGC